MGQTLFFALIGVIFFGLGDDYAGIRTARASSSWRSSIRCSVG